MGTRSKCYDDVLFLPMTSLRLMDEVCSIWVIRKALILSAAKEENISLLCSNLSSQRH